jgi:AcrR family transcriptional regulator
MVYSPYPKRSTLFRREPINDKQAAALKTRERLIEAALTTLSREGVQNLTLDHVAKEAQVSKGGLLHHFPSKDALVEAVLRYLFDSFIERVEAFLKDEAVQPGRLLRAYIRATFDDFDIPFPLLVSLLSYVHDRESLRQLIQEDHSYWEERLLNDGVPALRATIIRMTCDAYWMESASIIQSQVEGDKIAAELLRMTREG